MIPGAPVGNGQGNKTLAAIVFTDVAGFAHHANTDEQRALASLQRDMDIMRDVCARTNGVVLKTMGDGMLMRFPSANQALECALEIQRIFYEQAKRLPPPSVLWHRIGVHLGDVVTTDDDVYGDGVNVAARLQAEAKPGSIFLSRTVYDVVKGKMKLPAIYVGPRHLKGIAEPVAVWEVPPLGRQELEKRQAALMAMNMPGSSEGFGGLRGARGAIVVIVSILLLGAAATMLFISARKAANEKLATADHPLKLRLPKNDPNPTNTDATQTKQDPAKVDPNNPMSDANLVSNLRDLLGRYDFPSMVAAVQASPYAQSTEGKKMIERYSRLSMFMGWFGRELDTTDADHPITLASDPDHGDAPSTVYRERSGYVAVKTATSSTTTAENQLTPAEVVAITAVLEDLPGATDQITRTELMDDCKMLTGETDLLKTPEPQPAP